MPRHKPGQPHLTLKLPLLWAGDWTRWLIDFPSNWNCAIFLEVRLFFDLRSAVLVLVIQEFLKKALMLVLHCERKGCQVIVLIIKSSKTKTQIISYAVFVNITKLLDTNVCCIWSLGGYFCCFCESSPSLAIHHPHTEVKMFS